MTDARMFPGRWAIWCSVDDGVTGHREAWLKGAGTVQTFATEDEARAEAARMQSIPKLSRSSFTYTAREFQP
jgi:hypothetical protein